MSTPALAVLTAAGSGTRLGCEGPKALVEVGSVPMLVRAAQGLAEAGIAGIVITAPADQVGIFASLFPDSRTSRGVPVEVVAGSAASRQASVARGLARLPALAERIGTALEETTPVLVHDAARCLTPPDAIGRVIAAVVAGHDAVIPALPVTDTLKEVGAPQSGGLPVPAEPPGSARNEDAMRADAAGPGGSPTKAPTGFGGGAVTIRPVLATPDRSRFASVQTPQGFTWATLRRAHELAAERAQDEATAATDDAGLIEAMGGAVVVVEGDSLALKVTTRVDLALAELLAESPAL